MILIDIHTIKEAIRDLRVTIKGDRGGEYEVYGIDILNHKILVDRKCGFEWVSFDKIKERQGKCIAYNNAIEDNKMKM